ncbi:hypothetical protein XENTR_v10001241 [Xenopus tropicalis]|nr:hypothetical protein XENTR_v10001241 [Xenopus tropicalis]
MYRKILMLELFLKFHPKVSELQSVLKGHAHKTYIPARVSQGCISVPGFFFSVVKIMHLMFQPKASTVLVLQTKAKKKPKQKQPLCSNQYFVEPLI